MAYISGGLHPPDPLLASEIQYTIRFSTSLDLSLYYIVKQGINVKVS